jgi:hypothetical protein
LDQSGGGGAMSFRPGPSEGALAPDIADEQRRSNLSAIPHFEAFASHRERLTALVTPSLERTSHGRLCVLGAGNVYDLDLARLTQTWGEIHLVDIDPTALERAYLRQDTSTRAKLSLHTPIDLSGLIDRVDKWRRMYVTPNDLVVYPDAASDAIVARLPGPFDMVVSACVLTQMQLAMLNALSASHCLFEAARQLLNVMHLRTLAKLLAPGGRALIANDVTSNALVPSLPHAGDPQTALVEALRSGRCFYATHPDLLRWTSNEDPVLQKLAEVSSPLDVWLWKNGATRTFLVYAMELRRIAA